MVFPNPPQPLRNDQAEPFASIHEQLSAPDDIGDDAIDARLAQLVSDLADRMQRGESIDILAECSRYPEFADELKSLWGTMVVTEAVGGTSQSNGPNAEGDSGTWQMPLPFRMGDFELLEEIGRGGMGIVYRARQISLEREVAIKMILKDRLASPVERQRFFAEARATAKLEHVGIVPVYDVGEIEGRPYFVMKFIKGKTLHERIQAGDLANIDAVRYLEQVCRAVHFAHERGVVHR
ncbi:MAG: serine/threonine protein kinase, partial [Pirellula sp.]|nr:serine/threonine protein kinase [Pirellula sp.]